MLRERQYILRQASIAIDLVLVAAGVVLAHALRQLAAMYLAPDLLRPARLEHYLWLPAVAPLVTVATLGYYGLYQSIDMRTRTRAVLWRIALACVAATILLVTIDFFAGPALRPGGTARTSGAVLLALTPVNFVLLTAKTWLLRHWLMHRRRRGRDHRRVALVGSGEPLASFIAAIRDNPLWGMEIIGTITDLPRERRAQAPCEGIELLGDIDEAPDILWRTPVDEVVLLPDAVPLGRLRPLMAICEEMGVRTHLPLNFFRGDIARPVIDRFEDIPVLSYWPTRPIGPALVFKYAFDRVAAVILLVLLAVPMALVALAIRLTSRPGEPVLFGQTRCGLNGRLFTMWKFRTMRGDAEAQRAALEAMNEQTGPVFKMREDPRVTPLGRWLRKFSIDELPQLWNVARGEMSLVGPRPPLPSEVAQYDRWQRRRLSMKPGLTCLWQVSGRNRVSFETWMKLDLEYIDNWSLMLDFKILCRTAVVVVTGYGAM